MTTRKGSRGRLSAIPALFVSALLLCGCSIGIHKLDNCEFLEQAFSKQLSISFMEQNGSRFNFGFSDGQVLTLLGGENTIINIGLDGFYYINGDRSESRVETDGPGIMAYLGGGLSAVEAYPDWTFTLPGGSVLTFHKTQHLKDPDAGVRSINHRGYNTEAPENTLQAFRLSRLKGFRSVETDVRFTSDGIPVLLHDDSVDRTSNGTGMVSSMTFDEVRMLDFGSWKDASFKSVMIPSLQEFLDLCFATGLSPYLELKTGPEDCLEKMIDMVEKSGLKHNTTYISFSKDLLKTVSSINPEARLGFLCGGITQETIDDAMSLCTGSNEAFLDASDLKKESAELCRAAGIPLEVWTINSKPTIKSLPAYISGVTSDYIIASTVVNE